MTDILQNKHAWQDSPRDSLIHDIDSRNNRRERNSARGGVDCDYNF